MKVIDEAKTPNGVKLELVDWSDELPMMHKKNDTIYARPNIEGLQSRLLAFQLASPECSAARRSRICAGTESPAGIASSRMTRCCSMKSARWDDES